MPTPKQVICQESNKVIFFKHKDARSEAKETSLALDLVQCSHTISTPRVATKVQELMKEFGNMDRYPKVKRSVATIFVKQ